MQIFGLYKKSSIILDLKGGWMYKNLKVEMLRQNITYEDIAKTLNISVSSIYKKMQKKVKFSIAEINKIKMLFKENNDFEYLFAETKKRSCPLDQKLTASQ